MALIYNIIQTESILPNADVSFRFFKTIYSLFSSVETENMSLHIFKY